MFVLDFNERGSDSANGIWSIDKAVQVTEMAQKLFILGEWNIYISMTSLMILLFLENL